MLLLLLLLLSRLERGQHTLTPALLGLCNLPVSHPGQFLLSPRLLDGPVEALFGSFLEVRLGQSLQLLCLPSILAVVRLPLQLAEEPAGLFALVDGVVALGIQLLEPGFDERLKLLVRGLAISSERGVLRGHARQPLPLLRGETKQIRLAC